jgi:hypothetical protein
MDLLLYNRLNFNALGAQVAALTEFGLKNHQWSTGAQWSSGGTFLGSSKLVLTP